VFPDCADKAIEFYQHCSAGTESLPAVKAPATTPAVSQYLANTSQLFRQYVDVQLQLLTQSSSATCDLWRGARALTIPRKGTYSIQGGAAALANSLADAIRHNGGRVRLNTPVLRLAYDSAGQARGVDLLTGETVTASRAIISNLTVWDTFGKLVGLNRTPAELRKLLGSKKGWGAYQVYLGIDEATAAQLVAPRLLALSELRSDSDPESQFIFATAPSWDPRAPAGKRAATITTFTDVEDWFTFHESAEELEEQDQKKLEDIWQQLHKTMPELGDGVEVIETASPLDCYERTRRKLGMVTWPSPGRSAIPEGSTFLPNLFVVGDTAAACSSLASVTQAALLLANRLTKS
jgi:phytoene dehydrogenase-like protein